MAKAPLLLVLDDLQWCDGETLEWLHFLLRSAPDLAAQIQATARLPVVGTVRPEETDAQHPLTAEETATLATQVADRTLDSDEIDPLYRASAGNPLFVVEMVRADSWRIE